MPRIGRLHLPGGFYHVIGRGLERRYIFEADADKRDFLKRFGEGLIRVDARCLAWALMSNHYHFLIQVSDKPLSKLMASALGGFASSYNRRHGRCGYVFQNRYQSILIDADIYFIELVRYIHLNPIRAKMVTDVNALSSYAWTGHAGMLGRHKQDWHSVEATLDYFGNDNTRAKSNYIDFLSNADTKSNKPILSGGGLIRSHGGWQGLNQRRKEHIACIGDERILGSSRFVENALQQDELSTEYSLGLKQRGWDLDRLAEWVCKDTAINQKQLVSKARGGELSKAKSILCYLGSKELGLSLRDIANYLSISQPSVSAWVKKGELLCTNERLSLKQDNH